MTFQPPGSETGLPVASAGTRLPGPEAALPVTALQHVPGWRALFHGKV